MSPSEQYHAFMTIARREVVRVLRIWSQTLLPPAVTMAIYFVVFGSFLGDRIRDIGGHSYIEFITPGLVMMATITNSFSNVVGSFFSAKFQRSIEEILISPIPDWLIVTGYAAGGVLRGLMVGALVLGIALFFTHLPLRHPLTVAAFILLTSLVFSLAGFTNAVYAKKFDDISIIPTFVLTPMTYFAGVFYSIDLLPPLWRSVSLFNPILYMVDGFRFGFLGSSDVDPRVGLGILALCSVGLYGVNLFLLKRGVGLRS
ncbi:MAG: ABC transporter permease [Candidatus Eremiobacterota bacterium]